MSICVVRAVGCEKIGAQLGHGLTLMAIDPLRVGIIEINLLRQEPSCALATAPYFSGAILIGELVSREIIGRLFLVPNGN